MKKLMMIAAMMVAALGVNAQSRFDAGTVTIQPFMGGTGAMLSNMPDIDGLGKKVDATATGGAIVGAELEYRMTERVSVAAGVNWSQEGSGWEDTDISQHAELKDWKIETSYLNVPLTLNYYLFKGFAVKAGAQFGFLTSAKNKYSIKGSAGDYNATLDVDTDIKDAFNKFDLAIPVGVSYEFKVPIVIDLRFNIGVTKVNKDPWFDNNDSRNMVCNLTVGYKFKL